MCFNVAIDGPSGAGKSVIALKIADKYNLLHINSGAMYRVIALKVLKTNTDKDDENALINIIQSTKITLLPKQVVYMDGEDVTQAIRHEEISKLSSYISKHKMVRKLLVEQQQEMVRSKNCIMEGRDITTVVIPDAEIKIYLTASVDVRAKRRYLDLVNRNMQADLDVIKLDIINRDTQDMNRTESPLVQAPDAHVVDSSYLSIDETVEEISKYIDDFKVRNRKDDCYD